MTAYCHSHFYHLKAEPLGPSLDKQDVVSRVTYFLLKAVYLVCKAQRHCFKKPMILNKLAQQGDFNMPSLTGTTACVCKQSLIAPVRETQNSVSSLIGCQLPAGKKA